MTQLQPYTDYKDSDASWFGSVPSHWSVLPNRAIFAEVNDRNHADEQMLSVTITRGVIRQRELLRDSSKKDNSKIDKSAYKLVRPRDVAYNKMRAWQGAIDVSDLRGIVSPAYIVMRLRDHQNARYFHHLLRIPQFAKEAERWSYGITSDMWSLRPEHFKMIYTPLPPMEEQEAIVQFLEHANGRIERALRAKRKLIALLNEQKQAIIQHAVTKGLDPVAPLKPSGISWLGDIPQHWEITRVKNEFACLNNRRVPLSSVERGRMVERKYDYYGASGVIDKVDDYLFDDELLLIAEDGANLVLRNLPLAIIASGKFWVNNHAHILKPRSGDIRYLQGMLEGLNYLPWISGAAQPKLTKERLLSISIAVAPFNEQVEIVRWFQAQTAPLRVAIARAEHEIKLLGEYRTRLTADVVTGKVDVREAARHLPEQEIIPREEERALEDVDLSEELADV